MPLKVKDITKRLEAEGFVMKRQKSSHTQWHRKSDGRFVTVPKMKRVLSIGTVMGIERSTGIDLRNRGIEPRKATDHNTRPAP